MVVEQKNSRCILIIISIPAPAVHDDRSSPPINSGLFTSPGTTDLIKMRNDIGLLGELKESGDFTIPDYA